jgi:hypothetical protein
MPIPDFKEKYQKCLYMKKNIQKNNFNLHVVDFLRIKNEIRKQSQFDIEINSLRISKATVERFVRKRLYHLLQICSL